jgi:hypothetical protein
MLNPSNVARRINGESDGESCGFGGADDPGV